MNHLAANLRKLRMDKKLTQEQAAFKLGVSAQSVSRWETAATLPDVMLLPEIAKLYGVLVDDLFKPDVKGYENNARRLMAVYENSHQPEDLLAAAEEVTIETEYDYATGELKVVSEKAFSNGDKAKVKCYGSDDVSEGVAIMIKEGVDVSITGNSTNPTRFQHPVAGTYKKWATENGRKYFSVASGGGTGRTLHPDNVAAGPASYGMTDTMGRMHSDAQFAGSSSVPAHVEMMGLIGMGNNPMVGASVAVAVAVEEAMK